MANLLKMQKNNANLTKMVEIATEYDEIIKAINSCPKRNSKSEMLEKNLKKL